MPLFIGGGSNTQNILVIVPQREGEEFKAKRLDHNKTEFVGCSHQQKNPYYFFFSHESLNSAGLFFFNHLWHHKETDALMVTDVNGCGWVVGRALLLFSPQAS